MWKPLFTRSPIIFYELGIFPFANNTLILLYISTTLTRYVQESALKYIW